MKRKDLNWSVGKWLSKKKKKKLPGGTLMCPTTRTSPLLWRKKRHLLRWLLQGTHHLPCIPPLWSRLDAADDILLLPHLHLLVVLIHRQVLLAAAAAAVRAIHHRGLRHSVGDDSDSASIGLHRLSLKGKAFWNVCIKDFLGLIKEEIVR